MALSNGPNVGILVHGAIGEAHYDDLIKQWRWIDTLLMASVISSTITAQPGSPTDGDLYIVPTGATGASWSGNAGKLARYSSQISGWEFVTPKNGWEIYSKGNGFRYRYNGSAWSYIFAGAGTTAERPTGAISTGAPFFDTTIGKPIWFNGTAWVDATGTAA